MSGRWVAWCFCAPPAAWQVSWSRMTLLHCIWRNHFGMGKRNRHPPPLPGPLGHAKATMAAANTSCRLRLCHPPIQLKTARHSEQPLSLNPAMPQVLWDVITVSMYFRDLKQRTTLTGMTHGRVVVALHTIFLGCESNTSYKSIKYETWNSSFSWNTPRHASYEWRNRNSHLGREDRILPFAHKVEVMHFWCTSLCARMATVTINRLKLIFMQTFS